MAKQARGRIGLGVLNMYVFPVQKLKMQVTKKTLLYSLFCLTASGGERRRGGRG
jgi:hypothetical protein